MRRLACVFFNISKFFLQLFFLVLVFLWSSLFCPSDHSLIEKFCFLISLWSVAFILYLQKRTFPTFVGNKLIGFPFIVLLKLSFIRHWTNWWTEEFERTKIEYTVICLVYVLGIAAALQTWLIATWVYCSLQKICFCFFWKKKLEYFLLGTVKLL